MARRLQNILQRRAFDDEDLASNQSDRGIKIGASDYAINIDP
jgi:hypothetical protein